VPVLGRDLFLPARLGGAQWLSTRWRIRAWTMRQSIFSAEPFSVRAQEDCQVCQLERLRRRSNDPSLVASGHIEWQDAGPHFCQWHDD
jgi:hypothetical protein